MTTQAPERNASSYSGTEPAAATSLSALSHFDDLDSRKKRLFLAAYAETGTLTAAANAVGMARTLHNHWLKVDPDYPAAFERARQTFADSLEQLAFSRIHNPEGNRGGDVLLIALLNAHLPDKYRPNVQPVDSSAKDLLAELRKRSRRPEAGAEPQAAGDGEQGTG